MAFDISRYNVKHLWFMGSGLNRYLANFADPTLEHHILEIGSFEGLSACWFSDVFLTHPSSTLTCVDPFDVSDTCTPVSNETYEMFVSNLANTTNKDKCIFHKTYSDDFFRDNKNTYDIIYIDGSHVPEQITRDMENAFAVLRPGGIMWMDDYLGGHGFAIKRTMDAFLAKYTGKYNVLYSDYQLAIQKVLA